MNRWYSRLTGAAGTALLAVAAVTLAQTVLALDESGRVATGTDQYFSDLMPFSFAEFSFNNEQSRIDASTHFSMGIIYCQQERFEDALKEMSLALRLHPRCATLLTYTGDIHNSIGDIGQAIGFYCKALTYAPEYTPAHMSLARAYQVKRLDAKAIECYRNVIALAPQNTDAYRELAQLLTRQRRTAEAIEVYRSALRNDYAQPNLWYELAKLYGRIQQAGDAIDAYIKSLELDSSLYPAHLELARLYEKLGDYTKALLHYLACERIYHNAQIFQRIEELKRNPAPDDNKQHEAQHKSGQVGFLNSSEL